MSEANDSKEYARVVQTLMGEFDDFNIRPKDQSRLMRFIDLGLKLITFGMMRDFMNNYTTTIRYTVYTPRSWLNQSYLSRAVTLRHEAVHMRQKRRLGFLLFALSYLFLPFPVGVAFCRCRFEQRAYEETLRAYWEYYGELTKDPQIRSRIVGYFLGASYFWMWPFRKNIENWYDDFVSSLES